MLLMLEAVAGKVATGLILAMLVVGLISGSLTRATNGSLGLELRRQLRNNNLDHGIGFLTNHFYRKLAG